MPHFDTAEHRRLADSAARRANWKNWGPYVSDRAWGTVREDYSASGDAWSYFPHDHARSRAYRWSEDGIGGFCNRYQNVCLAAAFWNGRDPILKERFFGLTNTEGNHGEDVKEYYFYLDNTPTHSYCKLLYKYPQARFPYEMLLQENRIRGRSKPEFELFHALKPDFETHRYFDIWIEYAKADDEDILCRITAVNRGPEAAPLHVLPHVWYRNTWAWGHNPERPNLAAAGPLTIEGRHRHLGVRWWWARSAVPGRLLFTENDTNNRRLFNAPNASPYVKDAFHEAITKGRFDAVNPQLQGTKAAAHFQTLLQPGETAQFDVRYSYRPLSAPFADFDDMLALRKQEADEFYQAIQPADLNDDRRNVQRQALAGLLWSKQFYHYSVERRLEGDAGQPPPPEARSEGRNGEWRHVYNLDVLSMPDKWEFPWFASWDLAFHTVPLALVDPEWAKRQLVLLLREWYMHPNGQLPAYEWAFEDVNPPVHAWAAFRVYKIARNVTGHADLEFLEEVFHKLLLNFTWWVDRKDSHNHNVFAGGFLGLDNIGVFDRSAPLPTGQYLEQADSTGWMAMYSLNMMAIALELAAHRPAYEAIATKFFEHFVYIAYAINQTCGGRGLWDEEDKFYYDLIYNDHGEPTRLKLRSWVGLIPLLAVETIEPHVLEKLPHFRRRMEWFIKHRPRLVADLHSLTECGQHGRLMLSLVNRDKLAHILPRMLDPSQFLSDYGIRSLSRHYSAEPYEVQLDGQHFSVRYEPAESVTNLFGGNSNWRGPIWFPLNYLMIEALQKYHHYLGDDFRTELPRYSGNFAPLSAVAHDLSERLLAIFLQDRNGRRAVYGGNEHFQHDPLWRNHVLFHEYFHGENGAGLGASHQTGWTALVAKLIQQCG